MIRRTGLRSVRIAELLGRGRLEGPIVLRSGFRRSRSGTEERNAANGGGKSAVERRAAECQTEAPDVCRSLLDCPGRAGAEWNASGQGLKGDRAGQWTRSGT